MPCRRTAPLYRRRSTSRPTQPRELRRKPGSCLRRPDCAALGGLCLLSREWFALGSDHGNVMLIIVTILRSMSTTISIIGMPTTNAGIVFDKRLEKHPHPCRKRRHTGSEIGFKRRSRCRIFEKLGELAPDLVALPFTTQEIAQPVKCLHDAHRGSPSPEQFAGRGRTEGDRHVTELDRTAPRVSVHHDFGRDGVRQAQVVRCGHTVDKHPGLVASPDGVDDRARIGWVRFLGELVETRLIVEPAIDSSEGFGLRQSLQRLIDGVPRGEIDEIAGIQTLRGASPRMRSSMAVLRSDELFMSENCSDSDRWQARCPKYIYKLRTGARPFRESPTPDSVPVRSPRASRARPPGPARRAA